MSEHATAGQPQVIAVANQKGGVGKTTTAINLGAALVELGESVLLVDMDPQGNASTGLGLEPDARTLSTYDLLLGDRALEEVVQATSIPGLSIAPGTTDLSSADIQLASESRRTHRLRKVLRDQGVTRPRFDRVLIDCPPSLSLLTVNALVAADSVLVPLQSEFFALEGLSQLMLNVREIRETANPDLRIEGVVLTMYDSRNNLSRQVEDDVREALGSLVFQTRIPRNVRIGEAPSFSQPVLKYDTMSKGSAAYRALAQEIRSRRNRPIQAAE